jgi:hypothetical protein
MHFLVMVRPAPRQLLSRPALLIDCADAEIADLVAQREPTKKFCHRAGDVLE